MLLGDYAPHDIWNRDYDNETIWVLDKILGVLLKHYGEDSGESKMPVFVIPGNHDSYPINNFNWIDQ